jgi:transcriptional regulator with XRE-family HTH domain
MSIAFEQSQFMIEKQVFDGEGFYRSLAATVAARKLTWKQVSAETGVSPTTLTRMAQGRKPDASSLAILTSWAGLTLQDFVRMANKPSRPETAAMATALFRADPALDEQAKRAMETVVLTAYEQFKKRPKR